MAQCPARAGSVGQVRERPPQLTCLCPCESISEAHIQWCRRGGKLPDVAVMRASQLDAARLDVELTAMLREQFMKIFSLFQPRLISALQPELTLLLDFLVSRLEYARLAFLRHNVHAITRARCPGLLDKRPAPCLQVFKFSVWSGKPTPGSALMNLRYRDERSVAQPGRYHHTAQAGVQPSEQCSSSHAAAHCGSAGGADDSRPRRAAAPVGRQVGNSYSNPACSHPPARQPSSGRCTAAQPARMHGCRHPVETFSGWQQVAGRSGMEGPGPTKGQQTLYGLAMVLGALCLVPLGPDGSSTTVAGRHSTWHPAAAGSGWLSAGPRQSSSLAPWPTSSCSCGMASTGR